MAGRNVIGASIVTILLAGCVFVVPLDAATRRRKVPGTERAKPESAQPAAKEGSAKVTAVRFWSLGDLTRIAIETTAPFKYRAERIGGPERIFFDIAGAKPALDADGAAGQKGMKVIAVGDSLLKQIRVAETQPGKTRIVLDLEGKPEFTASQLTNPDRLIVEIRSPDRGAPSVAPSVSRATKLSESPAREVAADIGNPRAASVDTPHAASVDAKIPPAPAAPVVVAARTPARVFTPPPPPTTTQKRELPMVELLESLKIDRLEKPLRGVPGPPLTLTAGLSRRDRAVLRPPGEPRAVEAELRTNPSRERAAASLPAKTNANGDRSLTRVLGLKLGRVVIDAGHGGKDHGTTGPSGLTEKDLVLDIALRLGALLEDRLGSEVFFTRKDDTFIPLEDRGPFANERKADLFLSIHANSSPLQTASGVETYYLNFTTSKSALDVAARENASSTKSIHDLGDLLKKIALKDKIEESREFATRVQSSLFVTSSSNNAAARNRGIKKAPFVVLIGANMPAVLVEIGFLSNTTDEALMKRGEHRQKIAEALYKGVSNYAGTLSRFDVAGRE